MMEARVLNCGRTVLRASITTRTRVATSPRGPSMPAYRAVSPSAPTTARSTEHRPSCGTKRPTWSGPTTAVAQAWHTSTSPLLKRLRTSPTIHRPSPSFVATPWPMFLPTTRAVLSFHGPSHQRCRRVCPSTTARFTAVHCQT